MISFRYIILSLIYIIDYYFIIYRYADDDHSIYHSPYFVLFFSTFIFFLIVKFNDNNKCTNKLSNKYIITQSALHSIIALFAHDIYRFFIEVECIHQINVIMQNISNATYIPEGLFVSGIVLLSNQMLYLLYPKCN